MLHGWPLGLQSPFGLIALSLPIKVTFSKDSDHSVLFQKSFFFFFTGIKINGGQVWSWENLRCLFTKQKKGLKPEMRNRFVLVRDIMLRV